MERLNKVEKSIIFGGDSEIGAWIVKALNKINIESIIIPKKEKLSQPYADVTNYSQVKNAYKFLFKKNLEVKSIYYCAGVNEETLISESDPIKWENVINVNLMGAYYVYHAFCNFSPIQKKTKFVFLGSTASVSRPKKHSSYSISKLALEQLTNYINNEPPNNIRACCIRLGRCKTKFSNSLENNDVLNFEDIEQMVKMLEFCRLETFPDYISSRPMLDQSIHFR